LTRRSPPRRIRGLRHVLGICAVALATLGLVASAAGAPGGSGGEALRMLVVISIEQVEYADPPRVDSGRPFEPLRPGDHVFVRVRALRVGEPPLGRGQARIGVTVPRNADVAIAGRRGVRGCQHQGGAVTCPITIKLRDDEEASVLLRITIPEGLVGPRLRIAANVGPRPDAGIRIATKPRSVKVPLAAAPAPPPPAPPPPSPPPAPAATPWAGVWSWKAVWATGSFNGSGMTIGQTGQTVCARWAWSPPDGHAKGTASGAEWTATWSDGFGQGSWTLTLAADGNSFTGTQQATPRGDGVPFTATITGTRMSDASTLDCDTVPKP